MVGKQTVVAVTCTGFSTHEKQWVAQMCRSLGADYLPDLRANRSTHLVCRSMITAVNTPKYSSALRWGIKVVSWEWLLESAKAGQALPASRFKDDPAQHFPTSAPSGGSKPSAPNAGSAAPPPPPRTHTQSAPQGTLSAASAREQGASHSRAGGQDFTFAAAHASTTWVAPNGVQTAPWRVGAETPAALPGRQGGTHVPQATPPTPVFAAAATPVGVAAAAAGHGAAAGGSVASQQGQSAQRQGVLEPISCSAIQMASTSGSSEHEDVDMDMDTVIPGTQMLDDSPLKSTPESLTVFLAARRAALGLSTGPSTNTSTGATAAPRPSAPSSAGPTPPSQQRSPPSSLHTATPPSAAQAHTPYLNMSALRSTNTDNISVSSGSPHRTNMASPSTRMSTPDSGLGGSEGVGPADMLASPLPPHAARGATPDTGGSGAMDAPCEAGRLAGLRLDESVSRSGGMASVGPGNRGGGDADASDTAEPARVLYSGFGSRLIPSAAPATHTAAAQAAANTPSGTTTTTGTATPPQQTVQADAVRVKDEPGVAEATTGPVVGAGTFSFTWPDATAMSAAAGAESEQDEPASTGDDEGAHDNEDHTHEGHTHESPASHMGYTDGSALSPGTSHQGQHTRGRVHAAQVVVKEEPVDDAQDDAGAWRAAGGVRDAGPAADVRRAADQAPKQPAGPSGALSLQHLLKPKNNTHTSKAAAASASAAHRDAVPQGSMAAPSAQLKSLRASVGSLRALRSLLPAILSALESEQSGFLQRAVGVTVVKPLARMPRASTAKMAHALQSSSQASFCEQLQIEVSTEQTPVLLVARDKAKNVCLPILRRVLDTEGRPVREGDPQMWVIAEPVTFYSLKQDGSWWMEYSELMTVDEALRRASGLNVQCALPPDVQPDRELLKDVCCQHARLSQVVCCINVNRSKRIKPSSALQPSQTADTDGMDELLQNLARVQLHQRYEFDSSTGQVVTKEAQVTGLVIDN